MVTFNRLPLIAAEPEGEELRRCACGKELRASTEPPTPPSSTGGFQLG